MNRTFFIEGQYFGSISLPPPSLAAFSRFFYCTTCGEVYARAPVDNPEPSWLAIGGCCSKCKPQNSIHWQIPGSIWIAWDWIYNCQLPENVLKREFQLTVDYYDKGGLQWQRQQEGDSSSPELM